MTSKQLAITLDADAVFTRASATVGRPTSLDRIPGATLLGAAASRLYDALGDRAVEAFEQGAVRFGDALPLSSGGAVALPTPLSWHREKRGHRVFDLSQTERPAGTQLAQLRSAWRVAGKDGIETVTVERRSSMRTSIEAGRAREGFLYGVEALPAGTRFSATLASDDSALLEQVLQALTTAGIRLGRSRSAEFGSASVRIIGTSVNDEPALPAVAGRVRLLAVSDICLRDSATGGPRLLPTASDFGLGEDWTIDLQRSFLRFRRYSPFNGYRRRPDTEHQVIVAGSVITLRGPGLNEQGLSDLRRQIEPGVGIHLGRGLGQLLAEPALLSAKEPNIITQGHTREARKPLSAAPIDPAFAIFRAKASSIAKEAQIWEQAVAASEHFNSAGLRGAQLGKIRQEANNARLSGGSRANFISDLKAQFERGVTQGSWGSLQHKDAPSAMLLAALASFPASSDEDFFTFAALLAGRIERVLQGKAGAS